MYENFTDRSRKVMQLAQNQSREFHHEYIGTEHILLGLAREESGVAANVLKNLGASYTKLAEIAHTFITAGPPIVTSGRLPMTPKAKKAIEKAMEEARTLNHKYIGTEHLLLGVIADSESVVVHVLASLGIAPERVREETLSILGTADRGKELENHGMREAVKPLFLFMKEHGIESLTLTRSGGTCHASINME